MEPSPRIEPELFSTTPERLGEAYARQLSPLIRRNQGIHYTPTALTEPLVRHTLEPLLVGKSPSDILDLRICDPACGAGAFLVQAQRFLAARLAEQTAMPLRRAEQQLAQCCLYGVDRDSRAVELTRQALGVPSSPTIQTGDALLGFDWHSSFPEVGQNGGFDAILTNPPFVNAIDGDLSEKVKTALKSRFPLLRGTADLAYYFVALALQLRRPEGTAGLLLPRAFLNAPAARLLRRELASTWPPSRVWLPTGPRLFDAANVRTVAVVLGGVRDVPENQSENWWSSFASPIQPPPNGTILGDHFEIVSSLTVGMAYELLPYVRDQADGTEPRLVTTRLIDPYRCLWGQASCRYLKREFRHPRIVIDGTASQALLRRLKLARRPKVLVAGVAGPGDRVEAFVDPHGDHCGAVSTYSLFDSQNDVSRLTSLCHRLNGDEVAGRLVQQLGASAMGSGMLTITKDFLRRLPWQDETKTEGAGMTANPFLALRRE